MNNYFGYVGCMHDCAGQKRNNHSSLGITYTKITLCIMFNYEFWKSIFPIICHVRALCSTLCAHLMFADLRISCKLWLWALFVDRAKPTQCRYNIKRENLMLCYPSNQEEQTLDSPRKRSHYLDFELGAWMMDAQI